MAFTKNQITLLTFASSAIMGLAVWMSTNATEYEVPKWLVGLLAGLSVLAVTWRAHYSPVPPASELR